MKRIGTFIIASMFLASSVVKSQGNLQINDNYWQIGLGLGELPLGGSFKPSITFGYQFNEKLYAGVIYQFKDEISRDQSSFNVKSSELEGFISSSETVAQRFLLQVRYTPIKNGPYLSGGFIFNGQDTETMRFDNRTREIAGETYDGTIEIQQTRPAGWGVALGLGYQYNFKNGLSAGFEWTPAWGQYPTPSYQFSGTAELSEKASEELKNKLDDGFESSVTNMYKVFHIGLAYQFK
jgi:hypothetical protein